MFIKIRKEGKGAGNLKIKIKVGLRFPNYLFLFAMKKL